MPSIDKHAFRILRGRIRDILNKDWDPIGGCPADEYDGYVGKVAALIRDGATDDELLDYLRWAEADHMGFGKFDTDRASKVIALLRALGPP
jgi:hypothetical protein